MLRLSTTTALSWSRRESATMRAGLARVLTLLASHAEFARITFQQPFQLAFSPTMMLPPT